MPFAAEGSRVVRGRLGPLLLAVAVGALVGRRAMHDAVPVAPRAPDATAVTPAVVAVPAAAALAPVTSIDAILARDPRAEVRELGPDERVVLWRPSATEDMGWGSGGRASVFVRDGAGWHHVGDVDSRSDQSSVSIASIDPSGVAVLVETFRGNGAPPERVYAIARVGERIVTVDSGLVAEVDVDAGPAATEIRVARRPETINQYPDPPIGITRWRVHRAAGGLLATEESLTPWVDVLDAFCTGAHPELAAPAVRAQVVACQQLQRVSLRWTRRGTRVARLGLTMRCDADAELEQVDGAEPVVTRRAAGWRIVAARGCGAP